MLIKMIWMMKLSVIIMIIVMMILLVMIFVKDNDNDICIDDYNDLKVYYLNDAQHIEFVDYFVY